MRFPRSLLWLLVPIVGGSVALVARQMPISVPGEAVKADAVVAEVLGVGALESISEVDVGFEAAGRIIALAVDEGAVVNVGDELGRLDAADAGRDLAVAGAAESVASAGVSRAEAELARGRAALARARADRSRADAVFAAGDISVAAHDAAVEGETGAAAEVSALEAALLQAHHARDGAERASGVRAAAVDDGVLRSPIAGLVVARHGEVGEQVARGAPAFTIVATESMRVSAWVDETALSRLAVGQPARLVFRSEPQTSYPGRVERIGREVDRATHELVVDVTALELPKNFAVGQRADAFIEVGRVESALSVPRSWCEGGCKVVEDGRSILRPVTLGLVGRERVEVAAGLQPGDVVLAPDAPLGRRVHAEMPQ